jgi:hypothetical protein
MSRAAGHWRGASIGLIGIRLIPLLAAEGLYPLAEARESFMAKSTQHIPGAVVFTPWPAVAFSFMHAAGVPCGCRGLLAPARS